MKSNFGTFFIFSILYSSLVQQNFAQTPKVEIFYETLNDAVRRFFVEQFQLVSSNLLDQIDLRLYPYGSTVKEGTSYICPYGDTQCEANKLHACLIKAEAIQSDPFEADSLINQDAVSWFVNCFFKNRYAKDNVNDLGNACLPNDTNTDWANVRTCVIDMTDIDINQDFETITEELTPADIADGLAVRIDKIVNADAKINLVGQICIALVKTDGICAQTTSPTKVKLAIYYESFNIDAGNYLVNQLGVYYHVLDNFVDIELIPYGNTQFDEATQEYSCAQGDAQCISNKFQALVVDEYINKPKNGDPVSGPRRAVAFVSCLFQSGNSLSAIATCSNQKLQPDQYRTFIGHIKQNSDELVRTVFNQMRTKTLAVAPNGITRVPLVTVNGQVNYNAFDDLVQEVCDQYSSVQKASICTKANLTVLYEALNHQSRTLFLEQLKPVFTNLYNLINLQLIPVGRAVLVPNRGFACPGGANQCTAIKLQVCALDFFWNNGNNYTDPIRQQVFDFVWCVTKNKRMLSVMDSAEICSKEFLEFDAWFTIHGCFVDGTGDAIFGAYIEETSLVVNVASRSIPIVIFNGEEVEDLSNIKSLLCGFYNEYDRPDYCDSDMPPKVKMQVYYESMSEQSKIFFTTQLNPWYIYIEELVKIELYPAGNVLETNVINGACDSDAADSTCMANKLQALVIDRYFKSEYQNGDFDDTFRAMKFLSCAFGHANWKDNIYQAYEYCSEETLIFDDWYEILAIASSPDGAAIYKNVLDITAQFKVDNGLSSFEVVPWISMDNNNHSKRAAVDLLQTVCSQYSGNDKPLECTPVEVELYYSANHPQSRRFFLDQLIFTFRNLRERVRLQLFPFGVVDPNQSIEQECVANDKLCFANKVHACAIDKYFNTDLIENSIQWDGRNQTISFLHCLFKNINDLNINSLTEQCANQNIILAEEVIVCAQQDEGLYLLSEMRNKTMGQYQTMQHAPWIVINGLRSSLAESDLQRSLCDSMLGDKPKACYQVTPAKVKLQFHYSSLDSNSAKYVVNELYPNFRLLEEILDIDPIPFGLTEVLPQADGNYTLVCPNGATECQGNLIHACLYQKYVTTNDTTDSQAEFDDKLRFMQFLNCYFTSSLYPNMNMHAAESCVTQVFGDVWSTVQQCAQTDLGIQLLVDLQASKVNQLLPRLTYLPWITVNGRHKYSVENHIQRTVCDAYSGTQKPLDCYQIKSGPQPVVTIHYEPGDPGSRAFFDSILISDIVTNIAQLNLIPFGRSTYTDTVKSCVNNELCDQYLEHTCLIDLFYQNYHEMVLKTIACTFDANLINDPNVVNICLNEHLAISTIDPNEEITDCRFERGKSLMLESAALVQALTPNISHVPWIVINGEHNLEAEDNLANELCSMYYPMDKPSQCQPTLLDVEVYYETLNSDVNLFFLEQLSQYREYLDEIGQFTFIPYGSTTIDSNGNFTCVKGDSQCEGNRIHTCIINRFYTQTSEVTEEIYYKNRVRFANFLKCTSTRETNGETNAANIANECLDENFEGDYWRDVHFCAFGPEGDELYHEMGKQTDLLSPRLTSAPVITIGSEQNTNALINLFQALCNSYKIVRAPLCLTLPSLSVRVGIYFSGNEAGQKYLVEQVLPFYREILRDVEREDVCKLNTLISPDLVAWGDTQYDPSNLNSPFICSSGINECYINRFFACVNHHHSSEPRSTRHIIQFALCFFTQPDALTNPSNGFDICANRVWLSDPFTQLDQCATDTSIEAYDIFLKMKSKTENNYPILNSFPAVTINNVRDPVAEANLLQSSCINYKGYDRPAECEPYLTPTTTPEPTASTTPVPTTEFRPTQTHTQTQTQTQTTTTTTTTISPTTTTRQPVPNPTTTSTKRPHQPSPDPTTMNTTKQIAILALLVSVIISRILF